MRLIELKKVFFCQRRAMRLKPSGLVRNTFIRSSYDRLQNCISVAAFDTNFILAQECEENQHRITTEFGVR